MTQKYHKWDQAFDNISYLDLFSIVTMLLAENLLKIFVQFFKRANYYGNFPFQFDSSSNKCTVKSKKSLKTSNFRLIVCTILIFANTIQVLVAKSTLSNPFLLQNVYVILYWYVFYYSHHSLLKKRVEFVRVTNSFVDFERKFIKKGND